MNELALFAGAGGGILGGKLLGWNCVCAVEIEPYCRAVLCQRQNDGLLPTFPIWDDVRTFDGETWRGLVDVVSGGFPCQDISAAGKGAGIEGSRSGLWGEMARIISEVRPRYVFAENSPLLIHRGLQRVLGDLYEMGYDARWGIVSAENAGAPHKRDRIWVFAYPCKVRCNAWRTEQSLQRVGVDGNSQMADSDNPGNRFNGFRNDKDGEAESEKRKGVERVESSKGCQIMADSQMPGQQSEFNGQGETEFRRRNTRQGEPERWWEIEPDVGRVAHGVAFRVDRLKSIGNGQVPQAMALAWKILTQNI